jgi:hypothetical protein
VLLITYRHVAYLMGIVQNGIWNLQDSALVLKLFLAELSQLWTAEQD